MGHLGLVGLAHRPVARREELAQRPQTEVIAAPFQQRHLEVRRRVAQYPERPGNVGLHQLALEIARGGRNDDGRIVRVRPENGGHQIGERLAHARARLDHQMFPAVERPRNRLEHRDLPRTLLVAGHRAQRAPRPQMGGGGLHIQPRAVFMCGQMPLFAAFARLGQERIPARIVYKCGGGHRKRARKAQTQSFSSA